MRAEAVFAAIELRRANDDQLLELCGQGSGVEDRLEVAIIVVKISGRSATVRNMFGTLPQVFM